MKQLITIIFLLIIYGYTSASNYVVQSPDNKLSVIVDQRSGKLMYSVTYQEDTILRNCRLGLITDFGDLSKDLEVISDSRTIINEDYTLSRSKTNKVCYKANTLIITCSTQDGFIMEVEMRISDNAIAYRYNLPQQKKEVLKARILCETSTFDFVDNTTTFLTPLSKPRTGWKETFPSYEEDYTVNQRLGVKSRFGCGYTFPCLFKVGESGWALISESGEASNYCGCHLSDYEEGIGYSIAFPNMRESNEWGSSEPALSLPGCSPWRTVTIGSSLAPIVETTAQYDNVRPLYTPSCDYKPGRYTWSWLIWQDESCNVNDQKEFINLASKLGYEYTLIDANWDTEIGRDGIVYLSEYAKNLGVELLLWYNSNGIANNPPQTPRCLMDNTIARKKEMAWLRSIGVKGIKVDFFGGDKQHTMKLYEDILSDANDYGIMVIFHGCTIPRGWERLYPNYISSEACLASENVYFTDKHAKAEAFEMTLHPFIRNAVGSFDWGGVMLNRYMSRDNKSRHQRYTGDAFELATAITNQSSVNCVAIMPNNLDNIPDYVKDFLIKLPTTWDETRYIDGFPGKYAVIARKNGNNWWVGAINAQENALKVVLNLPMLANKSVNIIVDDPNFSEDSFFSPLKKKVKIDKNGKLEISIPSNGGLVIF